MKTKPPTISKCQWESYFGNGFMCKICKTWTSFLTERDCPGDKYLPKQPTSPILEDWQTRHCSGCTDPDPLGGTHCFGNIEHGPEPMHQSPKLPKPMHQKKINLKKLVALANKINEPSPILEESWDDEQIKQIVLAILQGGGHTTEQITKEVNALIKLFASHKQELIKEIEEWAESKWSAGKSNTREGNKVIIYDDLLAFLEERKGKKE